MTDQGQSNFIWPCILLALNELENIGRSRRLIDSGAPETSLSYRESGVFVISKSEILGHELRVPYADAARI